MRGDVGKKFTAAQRIGEDFFMSHHIEGQGVTVQRNGVSSLWHQRSSAPPPIQWSRTSSRSRAPSSRDRAELLQDSCREMPTPANREGLDWGDHDKEEAPDYEEQVYWEPRDDISECHYNQNC